MAGIEDDRNLVAAGITPLWVISSVNSERADSAGVSSKSRPERGGLGRMLPMGSAPFVGSGGDGFGDSVEDFGPVFAGAGGGSLLVEGVAGDEGQGEGGLGVDHLLVGEVDLAPGAGLFESGTGERAVAGVGHGDLDGVLVHGGLYAEDVRGYHDVLGEVLGDPAADHEQAGGGIGDLELGDLVEVLGGVDGDVRLALASVLVGDQAEAGGAVREGGAEDGHILLVGGEDDGVAAAGLGGLAVPAEVGSHLADELAGGVGAGGEGGGD